MKFKVSPQIFLLGLMLLAVVYYAGRVNYKFIDSNGDNFTYELIAQSVFSRQPFMVNIKFDYYDKLPIFHPQREFPPLHPVLLALGHLAFGPSMYVNILLTCFVGVLCAWPVYGLGRELGGGISALVAAALTVFSVTLTEMSLFAMSEPLFTLLSLGSLFFITRYARLEARRDLLLAGFCSGLTYLTRTNGVAVIAAITGWLLLRRGLKSSRENYRALVLELALYLGVMFITVFPWLLRNFLIFGDPFYYVGRFFAGLAPGQLYSGVYEVPPTLGNFFRTSTWAEIFTRYSSSAWDHLILTWQETSLLGVLAVVFLLYLPKRQALLLGLYLLSNFAISLFHPYIQPRHIINLFPVLFLLAAVGLVRFSQRQLTSCANPWRQTLAVLGIALTMFLFGAGKTLYRELTFVQYSDPFSEKYKDAGQWIKNYTLPNAVVMSNKTSPIAYYANRPVLMTPYNVEPAAFQKIVQEYQVEILVSIYADFQPPGFAKKVLFMKKYEEGYLAMILYQKEHRLKNR